MCLSRRQAIIFGLLLRDIIRLWWTLCLGFNKLLLTFCQLFELFSEVLICRFLRGCELVDLTLDPSLAL